VKHITRACTKLDELSATSTTRGIITTEATVWEINVDAVSISSANFRVTTNTSPGNDDFDSASFNIIASARSWVTCYNKVEKNETAYYLQ
jgi:hypothetical protein